MVNVLVGSAALNMISTSGLLLVSAQLQLMGVGGVGESCKSHGAPDLQGSVSQSSEGS